MLSARCKVVVKFQSGTAVLKLAAPVKPMSGLRLDGRTKEVSRMWSHVYGDEFRWISAGCCMREVYARRGYADFFSGTGNWRSFPRSSAGIHFAILRKLSGT